MDRTKTKLAAFFNNDEDEEPFPQKPVDDQKLSQYTQGTVRKSKREKEKEREEAKRREEEELAAKTYAEFLDAFEGDGSRKRGNVFVRASGSTGEAAAESSFNGRSYKSRAFDDEPPSRPKSPPSVSAQKPKGKRAMDDFLEVIKREQAEREQRLAKSSRVQGRSVTALAAYEGQSGSRDRGDPLTSNVFVANLPANISEMSLGNFFAAKCGPVGSVKIMWPRGDGSHGPGSDMTASRSKKNAGLSGFVSFMKRKDAEIAVREYDGFEWGGSVLRVGWSKAVPMASKAAYVVHSRSRSRSASQERYRSRSYSRGRYESRSRSRSRSRYRDSRDYSRSHSRERSRKRYRRYSRSRSRSYASSRSRSRDRGRRRNDSPADRTRSGVDPETEKFIRTVALKVKENGDKFEDLLRERERQNPKFLFLFDPSTPENRLYRSLIAGESLMEGFDDEGYNSVYSTDSAEDSERERIKKHKLGKFARKRFEAMLRALSGKRGELARCMAFSLEHAEAASEVSDIIVASLLVDSTPVPRKVARLHLICDILHNSAASVPSAWKFRQEFQARLGIVFDHLSGIYHSFPGRITAETFKQQILAVVDIWEDWLVFPPEYTLTLRSRLDGTTLVSEGGGDGKEGEGKEGKEGEGKVFASKFKASSFKSVEVAEAATTNSATNNTWAPAKNNTFVAAASTPAAAKPTTEDNDGEEDMDIGDSDIEDSKKLDGDNDDVDGVPIDDIDGAPIEDIDGAPIDDIDGAPIDDIDGEPIDGMPIDSNNKNGDDDDIDGQPIDEDIDGVPV